MDNSIQLSQMEQGQRSSKRYIVITAFLALFAIVGFGFYGLPFFFDFIMEERGWSRTVITSGNAVGKLIVAPLFGFFAGWLIDRYGPRQLMMTGALMLAIALIGIAYSSSLEMFYLFYVFNALGYVFGGPLPCQVLISRWFNKNRGKAMGIAYLGIGAGGALAPLLAARLELWYDWHVALAMLGVIGFLMVFIFSYFIKDKREKPAPVAQQKVEGGSMRSILRSRNFYLLAIGSMCSIGVVGGIGQHIKLYLSDLNYSQTEAAHVMSFVLLSSLIGRVLMGWLADIINRKYVMLTIYLIVMASIPLLLLPDFAGRIYIFAIVFGIGLGGDYMIIPLMAGDLFGLKALGRTMGIILVADGVAEALFPVLLGALYSESTGYTLGFSLLIGVALLGAIFISFLPKSQQE
ncbi:MAG TPA: MFS transporter [Parapedobacter sp.]|uniref:MFS transporter n=1 Tax=Parapedobacter sp. TaxID=1958893 RepID=UPI002C40060E|nr:MFS transporter [Parapedobacter sp.]HWK57141.1 MFS transporter [Parapedobacter sp.]